MLIALHNQQPCLFCGISLKEVEHTTPLQPDVLVSDLSSVCLLGKNSSLCQLDSNTPTITYKGIWFEISIAKISNSICISTSEFFFIPSSEEVEMVLMLLDMENQAL